MWDIENTALNKTIWREGQFRLIARSHRQLESVDLNDFARVFVEPEFDALSHYIASESYGVVA